MRHPGDGAQGNIWWALRCTSLAALVLAACEGPTESPKAQDAASQIAWPVVYELKTLKSPYMPGTVYTSTSCGGPLRSALEAAEIAFQRDPTWAISVRAWTERWSIYNAPGGRPCYGLWVEDLSAEAGGSYAITGVGSARTITLMLADGNAFAAGVLSSSGFPAILALSVPGYRILGGAGKPWDPIEQSTWSKR